MTHHFRSPALRRAIALTALLGVTASAQAVTPGNTFISLFNPPGGTAFQNLGRSSTGENLIAGISGFPQCTQLSVNDGSGRIFASYKSRLQLIDPGTGAVLYDRTHTVNSQPYPAPTVPIGPYNVFYYTPDSTLPIHPLFLNDNPATPNQPTVSCVFAQGLRSGVAVATAEGGAKVFVQGLGIEGSYNVLGPPPSGANIGVFRVFAYTPAGTFVPGLPMTFTNPSSAAVGFQLISVSTGVGDVINNDGVDEFMVTQVKLNIGLLPSGQNGVLSATYRTRYFSLTNGSLLRTVEKTVPSP